MNRQETEAELRSLAGDLGGGWRIEKGVMPVVVLTINEAREVRARLQGLRDQVQSLRDQVTELEAHGPHDES